MRGRARKIISLVLSFSFIFQQVGFASIATELNIASHLSRISAGTVKDNFRPVHIRFFSYDQAKDDIKVMLDRGDELSNEGRGRMNEGGWTKDDGRNAIVPHPSSIVPLNESKLKKESEKLMQYFYIGLSLPNDTFWVNLRPDSADQIIDQYLEKTDVGKIMLEADLQLKKDTAAMTSPATPEGKEYWDKLYKKAEELYGNENITIPTLTRPWIVPGEIIVRETKDAGRGMTPSAYIYKANLKVMLEQDYLKGSATYSFKDERSKALNEYSSQLIRELVIPKLTKEINLSKRYAPLRQVYYSIILSRWFKLRFRGQGTGGRATPSSISLIDSKNLTNLISKEAWSKTTYFDAYKKSFSQGEYNIKETVRTPTGQVIRSYFSGGQDWTKAVIDGSKIAASPAVFVNALEKAKLVEPGKLSASPLTQKQMVEDLIKEIGDSIDYFQSKIRSGELLGGVLSGEYFNGPMALGKLYNILKQDDSNNRMINFWKELNEHLFSIRKVIEKRAKSIGSGSESQDQVLRHYEAVRDSLSSLKKKVLEIVAALPSNDKPGLDDLAKDLFIRIEDSGLLINGNGNLVCKDPPLSTKLAGVLKQFADRKSLKTAVKEWGVTIPQGSKEGIMDVLSSTSSPINIDDPRLNLSMPEKAHMLTTAMKRMVSIPSHVSYDTVEKYIIPLVEVFLKDFGRSPTIDEAADFYNKIKEHAEHRVRNINEYATKSSQEFVDKRILEVFHSVIFLITRELAESDSKKVEGIKNILVAWLKDTRLSIGSNDLSNRDAIVILKMFSFYLQGEIRGKYVGGGSLGVCNVVLDDLREREDYGFTLGGYPFKERFEGLFKRDVLPVIEEIASRNKFSIFIKNDSIDLRVIVDILEDNIRDTSVSSPATTSSAVEGQGAGSRGQGTEKLASSAVSLEFQQVENIINALKSSIKFNDAVTRSKAIKAILAISPKMGEFLDLYLIKETGRIDDDQIAALRSRLLKESCPDMAAKRVVIFGDGQNMRLAAKSITSKDFKNLELVAMTMSGKNTPQDTLPFIIRSAHDRAFPGSANETFDFFHLGKQDEAIRTFAVKDFANLADRFPWNALAPDVVLLEGDMLKAIGKDGVAKLRAKGVKVVVSRATAEEFSTYIPGMKNESEVLKQTAISVAPIQNTVVALGVKGLSELGRVQWVDPHVVQPWYSRATATYREHGAHQFRHTEEDRFSEFLAKELGIDPAIVSPATVITTQISHGQMFEITVGLIGEVTKEQVINKFKELAKTTDLIAFPEPGVELTSNIIWGEKPIFFNPSHVYVEPYEGGTAVKVLFIIDENSAYAYHLLKAVTGKTSTLKRKGALSEPQQEPYAESQIYKQLAQEAQEMADNAAREKAEYAARKITAVETAKKAVLTKIAKARQGTNNGRNLVLSLAIDDNIRLLFAGSADLLKGDRVTVLYDEYQNAVGLYSEEGNTILSTSLLSPASLKGAQDTLLEYYTVLRSHALSWIAAYNKVEVVDVYRPAAKLRVRFSIDAIQRTKTIYKSVEQFVKDKWVVLAEPNMVIDPDEYKDQFVPVVNASGGRIGSIFMRLASTAKNEHVLAVYGPEVAQLAEFLSRGDYVQGSFRGKVFTGKDVISLNGKKTIVFSAKAFRDDPLNLPWGTFLFAGVRINVAVDATGKLLTEEALGQHREAGSLRAIATAPGKGEHFKKNTFVMNINDHRYDPENNFTVSGASCTTGCFTNLNRAIEVAQAIKKGFIDVASFIKATPEEKRRIASKVLAANPKELGTKGLMVTYHSLTNEKLGEDEVPADSKKASRKRDAANNIIPTDTGAARAARLVSETETDVEAFAVRFPTKETSMVSADYILEGLYSKEEILTALSFVKEMSQWVTDKNIDLSSQIRMSEDLRKMMAVISPDKIKVIHFFNKDGKRMTMVKMPGWYENEEYYAYELLRFVDEVMRLRENAPAIIMGKDGRLSVASSPLELRTIEDLQPVIAAKGIKSGFIVTDMNVSLSDEGKIKKEEDKARIAATIPVIKEALDSGLDYGFVTTHLGRPGGKDIEEPKYSLEPVYKEVRKALEEDGILFRQLPFDLNEAINFVAAEKLNNPGKKIVFAFPNIRFYSGEKGDKQQREEFAKRLIAVTGETVENLAYINTAMDKTHRPNEASNEMMLIPALFAKVKENTAAGEQISSTVKKVNDFKNAVTGKVVLIASGAKFDKYNKRQIPAIVQWVLRSAGALIFGGAMANPWLAAHGINVGKSLMPKPEDAKTNKTVGAGVAEIERLQSKGLQVYAPIDVYVTPDIKKPVYDSNYMVSIDKIPSDMAQIDPGTKTKERDLAFLSTLQAGDGIILNGGVGLFDKGIANGTFQYVMALKAAKDRGVRILIAGGDAYKAVTAVEEIIGQKIFDDSEKSTAGGALLELLGVGAENMPMIAALMKSSSSAVEIKELKMDWGNDLEISPEFQKKIEETLRSKILLKIGDGSRNMHFDNIGLCTTDDREKTAYLRFSYDALTGTGGAAIFVAPQVVARPQFSLTKTASSAVGQKSTENRVQRTEDFASSAVGKERIAHSVKRRESNTSLASSAVEYALKITSTEDFLAHSNGHDTFSYLYLDSLEGKKFFSSLKDQVPNMPEDISETYFILSSFTASKGAEKKPFLLPLAIVGYQKDYMDCENVIILPLSNDQFTNSLLREWRDVGAVKNTLNLLMLNLKDDLDVSWKDLSLDGTAIKYKPFVSSVTRIKNDSYPHIPGRIIVVINKKGSIASSDTQASSAVGKKSTENRVQRTEDFASSAVTKSTWDGFAGLKNKEPISIVIRPKDGEEITVAKVSYRDRIIETSNHYAEDEHQDIYIIEFESEKGKDKVYFTLVSGEQSVIYAYINNKPLEAGNNKDGMYHIDVKEAIKKLVFRVSDEERKISIEVSKDWLEYWNLCNKNKLIPDTKFKTLGGYTVEFVSASSAAEIGDFINNIRWTSGSVRLDTITLQTGKTEKEIQSFIEKTNRKLGMRGMHTYSYSNSSDRGRIIHFPHTANDNSYESYIVQFAIQAIGIDKLTLLGIMKEAKVSENGARAALSEISSHRNSLIGYAIENNGRVTRYTKGDVRASSAMTQEPATKGGIDFKDKAVAINYQAMGNFAGLNLKPIILSQAALAKFDIDQELAQLERMASSGIVPSGERIEELEVACSQKGQMEARRPQVLALLVKVGILQETQCCLEEASAGFKKALVLADTLT